MNEQLQKILNNSDSLINSMNSSDLLKNNTNSNQSFFDSFGFDIGISIAGFVVLMFLAAYYPDYKKEIWWGGSLLLMVLPYMF